MAISIADLIKQNTLGQSDGFPLGVPTSYNWYKGWNGEGLETPPANFTALAGWGQVYQEVGQPADSNPNATVQVANAQTYVHIKATGQWVLVENQSTTQLTGGHFATDFAGNTATTMTETPLAGGGVSFDAPTAGVKRSFLAHVARNLRGWHGGCRLCPDGHEGNGSERTSRRHGRCRLVARRERPFCCGPQHQSGCRRLQLG